MCLTNKQQAPSSLKPTTLMCLDLAFISLNHSQEKDSLDLAHHPHTHTASGVLKTARARFDKLYFSHVILHGRRSHVKLNRKDKTTSKVVPVLRGLHGESEK